MRLFDNDPLSIKRHAHIQPKRPTYYVGCQGPFINNNREHDLILMKICYYYAENLIKVTFVDILEELCMDTHVILKHKTYTRLKTASKGMTYNSSLIQTSKVTNPIQSSVEPLCVYLCYLFALKGLLKMK